MLCRKHFLMNLLFCFKKAQLLPFNQKQTNLNSNVFGCSSLMQWKYILARCPNDKPVTRCYVQTNSLFLKWKEAARIKGMTETVMLKELFTINYRHSHNILLHMWHIVYGYP